jgi:HNH nuclease
MNNLVYLVWLKATPIQGLPPNEWRRDRNGNVIRWSEYGRLTQYGWEIDHSIPKSRNGSNDISNLSPMRWRENREKSDKTQPQYELDTFIKNYREAMQRAKN